MAAANVRVEESKAELGDYYGEYCNLLQELYDAGWRRLATAQAFSGAEREAMQLPEYCLVNVEGSTKWVGTAEQRGGNELQDGKDYFSCRWELWKKLRGVGREEEAAFKMMQMKHEVRAMTGSKSQQQTIGWDNEEEAASVLRDRLRGYEEQIYHVLQADMLLDISQKFLRPPPQVESQEEEQQEETSEAEVTETVKAPVIGPTVSPTLLQSRMKCHADIGVDPLKLVTPAPVSGRARRYSNVSGAVRNAAIDSGIKVSSVETKPPTPADLRLKSHLSYGVDATKLVQPFDSGRTRRYANIRTVEHALGRHHDEGDAAHEDDYPDAESLQSLLRITVSKEDPIPRRSEPKLRLQRANTVGAVPNSLNDGDSVRVEMLASQTNKDRRGSNINMFIGSKAMNAVLPVEQVGQSVEMQVINKNNARESEFGHQNPLHDSLADGLRLKPVTDRKPSPAPFNGLDD